MRTGREDESGFTLIEMIVVMAIISILMGFGIGMFKKLMSVGKSTQARNTIVDLIQQVKTSSLVDSAALVVEPQTDERPAQVYGLVFKRVEISNFEPPESAEGADPDQPAQMVPGLAYKTGVPQGDIKLLPYPNGHTGGCLVSDGGGSVDFGNYSDYDLTEGVGITVWVYPTDNRDMTILKKGESYGLNLKRGDGGPFVQAYLSLSDDGNVGPKARGNRMTFEVPACPLQLNRWNGIEFHYDRANVTILIDSTGRGAVQRLAKAETRRIVPDRDATMTLGSPDSPFVGRADDLKVSGIIAGERHDLPDDVMVIGDRRTIRFLDGKLDPAYHRGPETIVLEYQDVKSPITIGMLGNILLK